MNRPELEALAERDQAVCLECGAVQPRVEWGTTWGICEECWEPRVIPARVALEIVRVVDLLEEDEE